MFIDKRCLGVAGSWLAAAIMLLSFTGCATNPVTGKRNFVMMSEDQEIQIGERYAREVIPKQYPAYNDSALNAYVNRIGEKLARNSHRSNLVYRFTVLDSPEVNAFALPGGYIYITRGILAYMQNEAQLAGVLGHEIGHVTARHSVRQQSADQALNLLEVLTVIGTGSQAAGQALDMLNTGFISGYGRKHELEADRLGAEYLARAGYDPNEMLGVVGILKNQEEFAAKKAAAEGRKSTGYHGLFASHPENDARLQEVIRAARKFEQPQQAETDSEQFLQRLDGLTFGHGEDQGVVRNNSFYHKRLDFAVSFPPDWRIENQPDRLLAVSPRNDTVLQLTLDDRNHQGSPGDYLQRKFESLSAVQRRSRNSAAGIARLQSRSGTAPGRVGVVFLGKRAFVVAGIGKHGLPPEGTFVSTLDSIRNLSRDEAGRATVRRIEVIRARPGDTFSSLARSSVLTNYAEDQLRLLNGMYPRGEPALGQLIKIVR
ncbi:MAG: M48 family metalloprotease [Pseudomonadota bacterium]|nr:M48 family metalloprotease [Pseudomonadota bacterium]